MTGSVVDFNFFFGLLNGGDARRPKAPADPSQGFSFTRFLMVSPDA